MKRDREGSGDIPEEDHSSKKSPLVKNGTENDADCKSYRDSLYRPPTSEEINSLKETENLFKSSLFRMQITELLSEVQPKKERNKALDEVLHELNSLLMTLPDANKEHNVSDMSYLPRGIKFPLPASPATVKGKFHFHKPVSVKVVGSYLLGTLTKPDLHVDVAVQMPKECFQPKDYLNLRYHHKRALYLCVIASHLKRSSLFESVKFTHMNGEVLRPILLLKPKGKAGKQFVIKLHPCLSADSFKPVRFAPNRNNVRPHWFKGEDSSSDDVSETGSPTPHYNASLLSDMFLEQHLHHLYKSMTDFPGMKDAIVLVKVWLHQRELDQGQGCFGGFLVSMLMSHLLSVKKVNKHMSSYQVLRVFLQCVSSTDWTAEGVSMLHENDMHNDTVGFPSNLILPSLAEFHSVFDVVFIDPSGHLNLCAWTTTGQYKRLKHEAKLSLHFLDSRFLDSFDILFMKPVPFTQAFDHIVHIPNINSLEVICKRKDLQCHLMNHPADWVPIIADWLLHLIAKGLGKRVDMMFFKPQAPRQWPVNKTPPSKSQSSVMLGLMLNSDHSDNVLDTGPAADSIEADSFRSLWGDKSELRRFPDGSILEAVVWSCNSIAEKRTICDKIIRHLLERHGGVDPSAVTYIGNQLDCVLQRNADNSDLTVSSTGEEDAQRIIQVLDSLCKQIRGLDLPLNISSLQGISPVFRGAEVFPPCACFRNSNLKVKPQEGHVNEQLADNVLLPSEIKRTPWCPAMEVVLQFETSSKWPDDIVAIQHIKAAFHLRLAELLKRKCSLIAAVSPQYIDVQKDGFVFRIKIMHYREMVLLQKSDATKDVQIAHEKLAKELEKEIVHLPFLTSTLHGLQQQFSGFSGTVRLAKRWMSAQLLAEHVTEESIELLVAYLFLAPAPFTPPKSPFAGFLRFLHFLSSTNWHATPIVLNFNSNISAEDYQEILAKFSSNRAQLPALFIATPKDKFTSIWTKEKPSKQILSRLTLLAKEAYTILEHQIQTCAQQPTDFKQIFRPPLDHYDVIIVLRKRLLPRRTLAVDHVKPVSEPASFSCHSPTLPVVNFDPVQMYVNELEESFSDIALFFHDVYGGDFVGVVWKPHAFVPARFKVLHVQYKMPVTTPLRDGKIQEWMIPNISAILSDFQAIGKGLVKTVELMTL